MTSPRMFDPSALERYRQFLEGLLDELENEIIPSLRDGTLKKAPALGSAPGALENASTQYAEFHSTTWRNLQYLRGTLHGMISGLQTAVENNGAVEEWVAKRMPQLPEDDIYA